MIENFDQLVARCQASRRRRMIRISLIVTGILLFLIAGISAYRVWFAPQTPPPSHAGSPTKAPPPIPAPIAQNVLPAVDELNETAPFTHQEPSKGGQGRASKYPPKTPAAAPLPPKPSAAGEPVSPQALPEMPEAPSQPRDNTVPAIPSPPSTLFQVNTQSALNPVDAYYNNPKYETAMAAARDFYAKENYIDAAIWAKKANRINREGEESWLLYARAMHAQGRTAEAIGILELYLNYKNSKAAADLIRTWR
ncbi:MAG: hypothetical protein AB1763_09875 [Campylobacterota bacterium]